MMLKAAFTGATYTAPTWDGIENMFINMFQYMCIHVYTYMYIYIYVYTYMNKFIYIYEYIHMYMCIDMEGLEVGVSAGGHQSRLALLQIYLTDYIVVCKNH